MHEELENFERNQVWTLVEPLRDVNVTPVVQRSSGALKWHDSSRTEA
jgi:hypothetical protein